MRNRLHFALALALTIGACTAQTGNDVDSVDPGNSATAPVGGSNGNGSAPAPSDGSPPGQATGKASDPQPSADVTLAASPAAVGSGATMTLTLRNGSNGDIGYNLCTSAIQTSSGRTVQTDRVCTMELRTLAPGKSTGYRYELPAGLAPGSYRFSAQVEDMDTGSRSAVRSNLFEVR